MITSKRVSWFLVAFGVWSWIIWITFLKNIWADPRSWNHGMTAFFGVHLVLLGSLIARCSYIPRVLGYLLIVNGVGYVVGTLGPYLFPAVSFGFVAPTYFGELLFMVWLLVRGWRIPQETETLPPAAQPAI